jgi:hypothetical protein
LRAFFGFAQLFTKVPKKLRGVPHRDAPRVLLLNLIINDKFKIFLVIALTEKRKRTLPHGRALEGKVSTLREGGE